MVKLNEIDLNSSHAVVAVVSALAGYFGGNKYMEMRRVQKKEEAENFGRTTAQYLMAEMRGKGIQETETLKATTELVQLLKEVRNELKQYKGVQ
jgi:hypothetical protein